MATRPFFLLSAASVNLTQATPYNGNLAGGYVLNTNAAARYLKLYTAPALGAAPVVGTTVPFLTMLLAPSAGTVLSLMQFEPVTFSGPVWFATTVNVPYTDTTPVGAGDLYITLTVEG
jgi:hypothetical protein